MTSGYLRCLFPFHQIANQRSGDGAYKPAIRPAAQVRRNAQERLCRPELLNIRAKRLKGAEQKTEQEIKIIALLSERKPAKRRWNEQTGRLAGGAGAPERAGAALPPRAI